MKNRKNKILAALLLLVGLPIYVLVTSTIISAMGRPPILLEMLVYGAFGILWALPFKKLFKGIGR